MRYECYKELLAPRGVAVCELDHPPPPGTDIDCRGPIRGKIKLTNVGSYIRATGTLHAAVRLACSRCLASLEEQLDVEVDEECALTQIDEPDAYLVGVCDVDVMPILDDDIIDLSELVRQNLIVNVPDVVLCGPECVGLCAHCGKNLNDGPCGCETRRIDPRLAKLQELLDRETDEEQARGGQTTARTRPGSPEGSRRAKGQA